MDVELEITEVTVIKCIPIIEMPAMFITEHSGHSVVPLKNNGELYSTEFPVVPY